MLFPRHPIPEPPSFLSTEEEPEPSDLVTENGCSASLTEGLHLIEGEDALQGAFCPRCHLCLRSPLVSVSEPKSIAGQDREGGTTNRASTRTEDSSSLGPTLSVCSDEPLAYTFKCLALLSLALKCQCSTWSQTWNTSLSLTICGRITLHSHAPGLWSGVPDPASRCPFSLT